MSATAQGFNPLFAVVDPKTKLWVVAGLFGINARRAFVGLKRDALPRVKGVDLVFPGELTPKDLEALAADPALWPAAVLAYDWRSYRETVNFTEDGHAFNGAGDELVRHSIATLDIEYDPEADTVSVGFKPQSEPDGPIPAVCV